MASKLTELARDDARKEKKRNVLNLKLDLINEAFPNKNISHSGVASLIDTEMDEDQVTTFLIDMAFSDPFAPYELKYKESDFETALKKLGGLFDTSEEKISSILETKRDALKAHRKISFWSVIGYGAAGVIILGLGGYFAAPVIASAIGAAAGLTGAAATAHGLALLGGGSLAMGGAGMAGGLYLVTGTAAAVGGVATSGGAFLLQLGAANAKVELAKLQVSYKEVLL